MRNTSATTHHYCPSNTGSDMSSPSILVEEQPQRPPESGHEIKNKDQPKKLLNHTPISSKEKKVIYKECRKNHAASIGGFAVDGCREFMAAGEEGTSAAFNCAACNCHRNFHRKEIENECSCDCSSISTTR